MVTVVEDGEELAVAREVVREAGPRQGVGDRVRREADSRCSPSVTIGSPVASRRLIESSAASSCSAWRSSNVILPSSRS